MHILYLEVLSMSNSCLIPACLNFPNFNEFILDVTFMLNSNLFSLTLAILQFLDIISDFLVYERDVCQNSHRQNGHMQKTATIGYTDVVLSH
jgi:hypothetical protein